MTLRTRYYSIAGTVIVAFLCAVYWFSVLSNASFATPTLVLGVITEEGRPPVGIESTTLFSTASSLPPGGPALHPTPLYRTAKPRVTITVDIKGAPEVLRSAAVLTQYARGAGGVWMPQRTWSAAVRTEVPLNAADSLICLSVPPAAPPDFTAATGRSSARRIRAHEAIVAVTLEGKSASRSVATTSPAGPRAAAVEPGSQQARPRDLRSQVAGTADGSSLNLRAGTQVASKPTEVPRRANATQAVAGGTPERMLGNLAELEIRFNAESFALLSSNDWSQAVSRYDMPLVLVPYPNRVAAFGGSLRVVVPGSADAVVTQPEGLHERYGRYPLPVSLLPSHVVEQVRARVDPVTWASAERKFYLLSLALVDAYRLVAETKSATPPRILLGVDNADRSRFVFETLSAP